MSVPSRTRLCPLYPVVDVACLSLKTYVSVVIQFMFLGRKKASRFIEFRFPLAAALSKPD